MFGQPTQFGQQQNTFGQPQQQQQLGTTGQQPIGSQPTAFGQSLNISNLSQQQQGGFGAPVQNSSLFGQQPAVTTFGQSSTNIGAPTTSTSIFAQSSNLPASGGVSQQPSIFGQQTSQQNSSAFGSGSMFGKPTTAASTTSTPFGFFGQTTQQQSAGFGGQQQLNSIAQAAPTFFDNIVQMKNAWDPQNPNCRFKHYLYNMVHPNEAHLYLKPSDHDESFWKQAQMDNPDPTCMVPALAIGFGDLKKRIDEQQRLCSAHQARVHEGKAGIDSLYSKHQITTLIKLDDYHRRHLVLAHRVLKLLTKVHVLRNKGYTIRADEEVLKTRLQTIMMEIQKTSKFRNKLSEIASKVNLYQEKQKNVSGSIQFEVADEEALQHIFDALSGSQRGLLILSETIESDKKDLEKAEKTLIDSTLKKG